MSEDEVRTLEKALKKISWEINRGSYMLMEYLGPIVDGTRAAFGVSVERAQGITKMSEDEFESYMDSTVDSFSDLAVCFKASDSVETVSLVFQEGLTKLYDECVEPNVVVVGSLDRLLEIFDENSDVSPTDVIGKGIEVTGTDAQDVVEVLGFLCYPTLLRIAKTGVDPSSMLSEDADSVIIATASDLVAKLVKKWVTQQLEH